MLGESVRLVEHELGDDGRYRVVQDAAGGTVLLGVTLFGGVRLNLDRLTSRRP